MLRRGHVVDRRPCRRRANIRRPGRRGSRGGGVGGGSRRSSSGGDELGRPSQRSTGAAVGQAAPRGGARARHLSARVASSRGSSIVIPTVPAPSRSSSSGARVSPTRAMTRPGWRIRTRRRASGSRRAASSVSSHPSPRFTMYESWTSNVVPGAPAAAVTKKIFAPRRFRRRTTRFVRHTRPFVVAAADASALGVGERARVEGIHRRRAPSG